MSDNWSINLGHVCKRVYKNKIERKCIINNYSRYCNYSIFFRSGLSSKKQCYKVDEIGQATTEKR